MDRPNLPTIVDADTEKAPCRPGAWGSLTNCATHEGLPLDETGRCFWGQEPSALEKAVHAALTTPTAEPAAAPGHRRVRLGQDDVSRELLDVPTLRRAKVPALLALARSLNVKIPTVRAPRLLGFTPEERQAFADDRMRAVLVPLLVRTIQEDRASNNPVVEVPLGAGPIRTVDR